MYRLVLLVLLVFQTNCVSVAKSAVRRGWLDVGNGHQIHFEERGPDGAIPAVYLHGGPGSGANADVGRLFDAADYRLVIFDQRGTGHSRFVDPLDHNTTGEQVEDLEKLRRRLGIERWVVVGGSWGSTLALAYAESHPEAVSALVVWGIWLGTRTELPWLRPGRFPESWRSFANGLEDPASQNFAEMENPATTEGRRLEIALTWREYESTIKTHLAEDRPLATRSVPNETKENLTRAQELELVRSTRIKLSYLAHDCFIERSLLSGVGSIKSIPGVIIQGTSDPICPIEGAATRLHAAWPQARYQEVKGGEHSSRDPGIAKALTEALASLAANIRSRR